MLGCASPGTYRFGNRAESGENGEGRRVRWFCEPRPWNAAISKDVWSRGYRHGFPGADFTYAGQCAFSCIHSTSLNKITIAV